MGSDSARGKFATILKEQIDIGQRIASNQKFVETAYMGQILRAKYLGRLKNMSPEMTLSILQANRVHYFFLWQEHGGDLDWSNLGDVVTQSRSLSLKIYKVRS